MGEKKRGREAVERLTKRIVEHGQKTGKSQTAAQARELAASVGRTAERMNEGRPTGAPRDVPPPVEQHIRYAQRIKPSKNRVFVDLGRGKK